MINMKKSAAAVFLLVGANSFAAMYQAPPAATTQTVLSPKEGVYLGVGVGASFNDYKLETTDVLTNNSNTLTSNDTSALGNVFLGYGHTFNDVWYLGGEANIYFPNQTVNFYRPGVNNKNDYFSDQFTLNNDVTVDLLPGYRFTPSDLVYARVGMDFRDATMTQQPSNEAASAEGFSNSTNQVGGRFGVGLTHALSEHFAASVDYFYTYFPQFGTYWTAQTSQFDLTSHSNYVGVSLIYTI